MKWIKRRCTKIKDKDAFTYLVKFSNGDIYIGYKKFRTIKNKPTNWKTYTTSSKYINERLKTDTPTKWIILKTFDSYKDALKHEEEVIRKYFYSKKCLNKSIGGKKFYKHPDTEEHIRKLRDAHKGKVLSESHKNNIKSSVAEYYAKNRRSKEHVQNNINSRKSKKQVSIKLKNKTFRSFKKAAEYLNCTESEVETHPLVLSIKTTIHKVPEYVVVDGIKYTSYIEAAKALNFHPSTIKERCISMDYPNFVVSYKRA